MTAAFDAVAPNAALLEFSLRLVGDADRSRWRLRFFACPSHLENVTGACLQRYGRRFGLLLDRVFDRTESDGRGTLSSGNRGLSRCATERVIAAQPSRAAHRILHSCSLTYCPRSRDGVGRS